MGASECIVQRWPSILPHLTTCSRTHAHHPSGGRTTPVVIAPPIHPSCVFTDSRVVSLFLSGVVFVWVSLSLALRCSRSLSLSLPPPFPQHTHAGDLIHRVYDHLASPRHRGCVAVNTMRVGVTIPTGWPPFSFGSAERTSSFYDERVGGRRRSGVDIYAYI